MGGCAAVERLLGGALPTRDLMDHGSVMVHLPAALPLRDAVTNGGLDHANGDSLSTRTKAVVTSGVDHR
jgi:hypothetical protein